MALGETDLKANVSGVGELGVGGIEALRAWAGKLFISCLTRSIKRGKRPWSTIDLFFVSSQTVFNLHTPTRHATLQPSARHFPLPNSITLERVHSPSHRLLHFLS